jgi:hypothetical protein
VTTLLSRDLRSKSSLATSIVPFIWQIHQYDVVMAFLCLLRFFKESSDEERGHAEKLMEYQVNLICLIQYDHAVGLYNELIPRFFFCRSEQAWREGETPVHRHTIDGV